MVSLGASVNAVNNVGNTPLHVAVLAENLRLCKDLCIKGANRDARNNDGQTPEELAKMSLSLNADYKKFASVLSKPFYFGCPVGRLPFMPIEKNNRTELLFIFLFTFIWLN